MAKADPTAQVLEQYDPGAGEFDPELDARPEPKKQAPPKDPETGRFLPSKAKHPASLVTRAKGLGLSDEEIGQYETADLRSEISQLQNERLIERTNASIQRAIDSPEPENPRPQVMPREEKPAPVDDAFDLGVPADKYSEDLISDLSRALTKLRNDLRAEFKESLEKEVGPVRQFQSHQQATAVLNKLDKKFAAKPEIYGAGATEDLAPESPERFRREAVLGQMSGLLKSKRATTPEKDWEKIDSLLYPGKPHVETEQPVERNGHQPRFTQDQWDESASPMPTHRKPAAEPHGDRRAVKAVAAKLREQNQSNGYGDEEQDLE